MRTRVLAAAGVGLAAVAVALMAGSVESDRDPLESVDLVERMRECVLLRQEAGGGDVHEPSYLCSLEVMRSGIRSGRYNQLLMAQEVYARPEMWATCHAVGHSLGPELIQNGMRPEAIFHAMFGGEQQQQADHFCAAALVHGVIDGLSADAEERDLPGVAEQCGIVNQAHSYYGNECAHYFGHAVWNVHRSVNRSAAEACRLMDDYRVLGGLESCLGGVSMEKFGLQDDAYGIGSGVATEPPSLEEIEALCRELEDAEDRVREGCWGGAGWLISTILQRDMNAIDPEGDFARFPAHMREEAIATHLDLMAACRSQNCLATLLQHVRPQEWTNGIGDAICRLEAVPGREELNLEQACLASINSGIVSR